MKKRLMALFVVVSALLAACDVASEPSGGEVVIEPGGTVYFNPQTGDVFTNEDVGLAPQGFSLTLCAFRWNYVHQTSRNGVKEIKGDWTGSCPSSQDSFYLDPNPGMLKRNAFGVYGNVSPRNVVGVRKLVGGSGASWVRTEVFMTVPCVNGSYKSKIDFVATNPNGVALSQKLASGVSAAATISTCG